MSDRQEISYGDANTPEKVISTLEPKIMEAAQKHGQSFFDTFQKYYGDRVTAEFALAKSDREQKVGAGWRVGRGFYKLFVEEYTPAIETFEVNNENLIGVERIWDLQIKNLLEKRKSSDKPVVIMDFGGGRGLSMIRLATKYKEQIVNGDVVFVVTNLGYSDGDSRSVADMMLDDNKSERLKHFSQDEINFVWENQKLVNFIDALACELPNITIKTARGGVSLNGNVDVLHESSAVIHTQTPDVALAVFGTILSDEGTFFLQAKNRTHGTSEKVKFPDGKIYDLGNNSYESSRDGALIIGREILEKNFKLKPVYETLKHRIYTKPLAPDFKELVSKLKKTSG